MTFLVFPAIIVLLETPFIQKCFNWIIWGEAGKISFSVYIMHNVMLLQMNTLFHALHLEVDYSHPEYMFIFAVIAEIVGAFFYYCAERPIARLVNAKIAQMNLSESRHQR